MNAVSHSVSCSLSPEGDIKFLFAISGRRGYASKRCVYCQLKQKEWNKTNQEKEEGTLWTYTSLCQAAQQNLGEDNPTQNAYDNTHCVKEMPLWKVGPDCMVPPILHIPMGLVDG